MIKLEDIKFRIGNTGEKGGKHWAMALIYIDARVAHEELDSKYKNWNFTWSTVEGHPYAIKGKLEVQVDDKQVVREDVGYPQDTKMSKGVNDTEALKDAVSDALKRCAVTLGIGRELYQAPKLFSYNVKMNTNTGKVVGFTDDGEKEIEAKIEVWYKKLS